MKKPTLSPSRITTYLACPMKYRWTYIHPAGKWFLRSKSYYSFGISLHAALQRLHDSADSGVQTIAEAVASLEENWVSAGYNSPEEAAEALAEGRELLLAYAEAPAALEGGAETIYVEKQLRHDFGTFYLSGRLDRVDKHSDGTHEIIDYKSGSHYTKEQLENDVAANCYNILLRTAGVTGKILTTILTLRTQERTTVEIKPEALAEFNKGLLFIGERMLNREYDEIEPKVKRICENCDFLPLCRKHQEFAEEFDSMFSSPSDSLW